MPGGGDVLADNEVVVVCGRVEHVLRGDAGGRLELLGHPGPREDDDVLVALSGGAARCRQLEEAWNGLGRDAAGSLLDASPEKLTQIAQRLPATLEQRERVRRRDDLPEGQRASLLRNFDQAVYLAEVASLGPALAAHRAATLVGPRWRRGLRRWGPAVPVKR
jgi:hypothetical protein